MKTEHSMYMQKVSFDTNYCDKLSNKKAVLSQRWPRNAPYGTPWLCQRLLC